MIRQDILEKQAKIIYLSLGSNLGNKINNIEKTKLKLSEKGIKIIKSSSYYDKVHPCWVTVQSLVAKGTFHNETYERWVKNVVRESNFDKLGYSAKWNMSSNKKKTAVTVVLVVVVVE